MTRWATSDITCIEASQRCGVSSSYRNQLRGSQKFPMEPIVYWKAHWAVTAPRFHQRCDLNDHERFEELTSLAPLGELSQSEHKEFIDHLDRCNQCREVYRGSSAVAEAAFVVGSTIDETPVLEDQRYRRARHMIARRLSPAPLSHFHLSWTKVLAAAGAVAALVVSIYVGGAIWHSRSQELAVQIPAVRMATDATVTPDVSAAPVAPIPTTTASADLAMLEHELEITRNEKRLLQQKIQSLDQNLLALTSQVADLGAENKRQAQ